MGFVYTYCSQDLVLKSNNGSLVDYPLLELEEPEQEPKIICRSLQYTFESATAATEEAVHAIFIGLDSYWCG